MRRWGPEGRPLIERGAITDYHRQALRPARTLRRRVDRLHRLFRLPLLAAVIAWTASATGTACAQAGETEWWKGVPRTRPGAASQYGSPEASLWDQEQTGGTGGSSYAKARDAERVATDLRPGDIPWRSGLMLEAIDSAFDYYQRIANAGGWPSIPPGRMMRPGEEDERIPLLRRRLRITGDLRHSQSSYGYGFESYEYGQALEEAVKRFQRRHGLRVTGRVDQPTTAALNVSVEERLAQLMLNRNRIRDLVQRPHETRYILVNVPAFQLEAVEGGAAVLRHRVIVGRPGRNTPELRATVRALNFFPSWKVPDSIAQADLIPKAAKEPEYLESEKIRIFENGSGRELNPYAVDWHTASAARLKFRQDPGPQNALGLVRLDMSNEYGVYMHDTPLKKLFAQRGRAFSAGCVRVDNVFRLAEWIARDEPGFETPGRAEQILAAGEPVTVDLKHPVPVYFTYITAWAEPEQAGGTVEFRPDIYNKDGSHRLIAGSEREADEPLPPPALAP